MARPKPPEDGPKHIAKKCHECYTYVPLEAEVCPYCKARLGKVTRHGFAERLTDWKSYIYFFVALIAFLLFCRFAFFD